MKKTLYSCPSCGAPLFAQERALKCESGHSFDLAKEGYVNLLLGKGGGTHGDNREMLLARKTFLSYGYYQPMAQRVAQLLCKYAQSDARLLDIGCGEGYYTEIFADALASEQGACEIYAMDISREAVRLGAKRPKLCPKGEHPRASLAVASAYRLPYLDGAFSLVTNLFSPLDGGEIRRVLADGGIFVMVIPEKEHLYGLKAAIYDTPYKNEVAPFELEGFALVENERMRYEITMHDEQIGALFGMTPYAYRTSALGRQRIAALNTLRTDVDFHILVYKRA